MRDFANIRSELLELDSHIHSDDWGRREARISAETRVRWLRWRSARALIAAYLAYPAVIVAFVLISLLYRAVVGSTPFLRSLTFRIEDLYYSATNGGANALLLAMISIAATHLLFSRLVKNDALLNKGATEQIFASGSFRSEGAQLNVYVLFAGLGAALIFAIASGRLEHTQLSAWWQVALAGAVSGYYIDSSLERFADAINVRRFGTIERTLPGYFDADCRRYVRHA